MKTFCVLDFINVNNLSYTLVPPSPAPDFDFHTTKDWNGWAVCVTCLSDAVSPDRTRSQNPFLCSQVTTADTDSLAESECPAPHSTTNHVGSPTPCSDRSMLITCESKPGLTCLSQSLLFWLTGNWPIRAWESSVAVDNQTFILPGKRHNVYIIWKTKSIFLFFNLTELLVQSLNVELVKLASSTILSRTCSAVFVLAMVPT